MEKAIELENICKKYIISHEKDAIIRNILPHAFRVKQREEFWALRDINITLPKGECLGIVGPNGAGKSTLLNIIAGISSPSQGTVNTNGRIVTLLTLGAGFHPELTGEENIFLNGTILGMTPKEISAQFDRIVSFSELGGFIDSPLQTYSSGMILRLGFSIAMHASFDILLMDEIISVGDLSFQNKCIDKINYFKKNAKTLIFSSQSLGLIESLADKVVLLYKGRMKSIGMPARILKEYQDMARMPEAGNKLLMNDESIKRKEELERPDNIKKSWGKKYGSKEIEIINVKFFVNKKGVQKRIRCGSDFTIQIDFRINREVENVHIGAAIFREDMLYCYGPNTAFDEMSIEQLKTGYGKCSLNYPSLPLCRGKYFISIGIWDKEEKVPYDYHCAFYAIDVAGKKEEGFYREAFVFKKLISKGDEMRLPVPKAELTNRFGSMMDIFNTGEPLNLHLSVYSKRIITDISVLAVRKSDGAHCFKMNGMVFGKGLHKVKFIIQKIKLLQGEYYLRCEFCSLSVPFKVNSEKKDHGVVFIEHDWKLEV